MARQDTMLMERKSPSWPIAGSYLPPIAAGPAGLAIFLVDTMTDVSVAVGILFVPVIIVAARFCRPRGVVLIALGCVALALMAHFVSPGDPWTSLALTNRAFALSAIGITTFLVVKNQSAEPAFRANGELRGVAADC